MKCASNHRKHLKKRGGIVVKRSQTPNAGVATENDGIGILYVGPSVDGGDKEFIKVLTGEVDRRKPSFL